MEKIIIDTDPGIDDAVAIFYAINSGKFDIKGLTTVFGNVEVGMATTNALKLLEIAEQTHIPVAQGAARPLVYPYGGAIPHIHGDDGQGNVFSAPPATQATEQTAVSFIIEQIMSQPGEITLVPIGPLTNIALALQLEPEIASNVKRVVLMGGAALVPGNVNPAAEANIYNDPEAAKLVFEASWDVTMVGLDVTHQVLMTEADLYHFSESSKATAQYIGKILPVYAEFATKLGMNGLYMHDATAITYLLNPDLFDVKPYPLKVDLSGDGRGKTWVWSQPADFPLEKFGYDSDNPVNVVISADVAAANQLLLDIMC
ncbi:MAG: nucleoside hydrolase [Aggregatilineales bacterium]